ncbi:EamA family transporter [Knoellia sp. CPCC 206453]|uniref:EamA family transporter n=1 Tax=Knoellia pratensis TaxID=3404796 RepID=UPI0036115AFF
MTVTTTSVSRALRAPARRHRPVAGLVAALVAAVMFGVNGTVSKLALENGLSSLQLVEIRSVGSAVLLVALMGMTRPRALRVTLRDLGFLLPAGVVGIGLVQWLYFVAIARLPVGIALLVQFLAPVIVVLWVRLVRREPVRARLWAAQGLALLGLAVVVQGWRGLTLDGVGLLAALGAAVALAAYYLTGEKAVAARDELSLAAWLFLAAGVFWSVLLPWWTFPFSVLAEPVALPGPLSGTVGPVWALVAWIIVLGTVAPFALVLTAIRAMGPARSGLVGMAEPVVAALCAWAVMGELLTLGQLAGGAAVLCGIALAETARRGTPAGTATHNGAWLGDNGTMNGTRGERSSHDPGADGQWRH